jgi:hypothetical protein
MSAKQCVAFFTQPIFLPDHDCVPLDSKVFDGLHIWFVHEDVLD